MSELINYKKIDDHIAILTLHRSDAANAMSRALLEELNKYLADIEQDSSIRCTIITGEGAKAFCAGADLKERKGMSEEQVIQTVRYIGDTVSNVAKMKMPVIAAINGVAFGGGLELALACDIRVAVNTTKIGLTETSLAIIPGAGGTQRLARLIGIGQAKRLIFTGKPISTEEALNICLVEQLADQANLLDEATKLAKQIANNGPLAVKQAKTAIDKGMQTDLETGLTIEHLCYKETIPTADRLEGLDAFKEKRKPEYTGK